jgi:hypothetical protein
MLLGQLVAISVASSLFFLALASAPLPTAQTKRTTPLVLWAPVALSMLAIVAVPHTSPTTFLPNLLAMHGLLIVPLLPLPSGPDSLSLPARQLYRWLALPSFALRLLAFGRIYPLVPSITTLVKASSPLFAVLRTHPAQSSISADVFWASVTFGTWAYFAGVRRANDALLSSTGGPVSGLFVIDALHALAAREGSMDCGEASEKRSR